MRGLLVLGVFGSLITTLIASDASGAEKSVFQKSPFQYGLNELRQRREEDAQAIAIPPSRPVDTAPANIDQIAVDAGVPANVLAAISQLERDTSAAQVTTNAQRLKIAFAAGKKVEDIVSPEVRAKALQIGADTYGYLPESDRTKKWLGWYDYFFGYRYAEECATATSSRDAASACYALYPSIRKIERAERNRVKHDGIPVWAPD